MKKKMLAGLLSVALVFSTISTAAFAQEGPADLAEAVQEMRVTGDQDAISESAAQFADVLGDLKEETSVEDAEKAVFDAQSTAGTKVRRPSVNDYCQQRVNFNGYVLKQFLEIYGATDAYGRKCYQNSAIYGAMWANASIAVKSQNTLEFTFQLRYPDQWYPSAGVSFDFDLTTNTSSNVYGAFYVSANEYITAVAEFDSSSYDEDLLNFTTEITGNDPTFDEDLCMVLSSAIVFGMDLSVGILNLIGCSMSDIGFEAYDERMTYGHYASEDPYHICALCGTEVNPFIDVYSSDWFYDYVEDSLNAEYMKGLKDNVFGPADNLARSQFALILYRLSGSPAVEYTSIFKDVAQGVWYTDAIIWANSEGVVTGYANGNFGVADNITREQMATMMYRYAVAMGYDVTRKVSLDSFSDGGKVTEFAKEAMQWAVATGIISGKNNTTLDPQGNANRAECATIITRFVNAYPAK